MGNMSKLKEKSLVALINSLKSFLKCMFKYKSLKSYSFIEKVILSCLNLKVTIFRPNSLWVKMRNSSKAHLDQFFCMT